MHSLAVLLTNFDLDIRGGSQLYLRDVALALQKRGHTPFVYSPKLGAVARELSAATIPVTDDLCVLAGVPDIIHGHHNHELLTALLRFPGVPAVRVCHGWLDERPQPFPRVLRYIAVDDTTRDRCLYEWGIAENSLEVLLNFVDLDRFASRRDLPAAPAKALVFSHNARDHFWAVRKACESRGIAVDATGHSLGNATDAPERLLSTYDVVFAKGRAAIEALACGCSVILCDSAGVGPLVTSAGFDGLRRLNFGIRALRQPVSAEAIEQELRRYDAGDAAEVTRRLRALAGSDAAIDTLIACYERVIEEYCARTPDPAAELRAAASYLQFLSPRVHASDTPAHAGYMLLRSLYFRATRTPALRHVVGAPAVGRLSLRIRDWRRRHRQT